MSIKQTLAQVLIPCAVGSIATIVSVPMLNKIHAHPTNLLDYSLLNLITVVAVTDFCFLYTTTLHYAVACIHTCRKVYVYITCFAYNASIFGVIPFCKAVVTGESFFDGFLLTSVALHFTGILFLFYVTQLPIPAFTALEGCNRIKAMVEAMDPMEGRKKVVIAVLIGLHGVMAGVAWMVTTLIVYYNGQLTNFRRLVIGISTGVLVVMALLLIIVGQRIYLVTNSYVRR